MRKINLLLIILISALVIHSCERDDICAESTPTTPQIIFRFFDSINREDLSTVNDLMVFGLDDNNERVNLINILSAVDTDSIALPLRTDIDETRFLFIENTNDTINENIDTLSVAYLRRDVFISRACGFANNFDEIQITVANDTLNWIMDSEVIRENVEDETSAHVQIFH